MGNGKKLKVVEAELLCQSCKLLIGCEVLYIIKKILQGMVVEDNN